VQWLGHSSFLLTSPAGVRVLTDPNGLHPPSTVPDVVTISNLHMTHASLLRLSGTPHILWGISPERGWNPIQQAIKDLTLFNIPSYSSRIEPENSPIQNSMFLFRVAGVCIAHLGNLRHPLTPTQLQRLGRPDVLMIPVDGQWTLGYDEVLAIIEQLQPLLVLPMHIDFPQHAEVFVHATRGRYPVRRLNDLTLPLQRGLLPSSTEIVVFGGR
jgi:L-ascorbate metabolism protein UlaG (beta-lactamase superfamily)